MGKGPVTPAESSKAKSKKNPATFERQPDFLLHGFFFLPEKKGGDVGRGGPTSPVRCFGSEGEQSVAEEKKEKGGDAERGRPGISGEVRLL